MDCRSTGGLRIPALVIPPFSAAHAISHMCSQRSAVIRFINELFGLTPLADLPEEKRARGTADDMVPMGDPFEDFDNDRLLGRAPPHSQR